MDRRDFIAGVSLSALGAAMGVPFLRSPASALPGVLDLYGGTYKVSLNCYSFNTLLTNDLKGVSPRFSLLDLLDFCAANKFDAIDIQGYYFPGYSAVPTDVYISDVKTRAHDLGLAISGTGVNNNFASTDAAARAADVQLVKNWIGVAAKLGAPVIRVFSGTMPAGYEQKWDEVAAWMADSLKQCADFGKLNGVRVIVQNHADMLKTADQIIKLVQLVNSDNFGVLLDTGSFVTANLYADLAAALPYATNFLIKQNVENNLGQVIGILRDGDFQGTILIEALSGDPLVVVPAFLKKVRDAIALTTPAHETADLSHVNDRFVVALIPGNHVLVSYTLAQPCEVSFRLFDGKGRLVRFLAAVPALAGSNRVYVSLDHIASGAYCLGCFSGNTLRAKFSVSIIK
jgi:sugar phosphate isomerase/epimerase